MAQNKKILFVAQKLTALEVVKRLLDESNLGDAVLELHSHKSHPRAVLNSLDETLRRDCPEIPDRHHENTRLKSVREQLDCYAQTVGTPLANTKVSYVEALGRFMKHRSFLDGIDAADLDATSLTNLSPIEIEQVDVDIRALSEHLQAIGTPTSHIFSEIGITEVGPVFQEQVGQKLSVGLTILDCIESKAVILAHELQLDEFKDIAHLSV